ncbi:hypothetical protein M9Y10_016767 [Tritrichomonas musculus]|uniref:Uncharacterized protein n=1 Tax=Tritrichomonas musculus TaxID=1915356 RepID=A0ABR2HX36_9EUKA
MQKVIYQTKQELDQTKQELDQTKQELDQTKIKLEQALNQQSELKKAKDHSTRTKQYAQSITVDGKNSHSQLHENSTFVDQPQNLSIDPSSLLSYSIILGHAVIIKKNGQLLGAGSNNDCRISSKLTKETISHFTEFSINDKDGSNLVPVSAVCSASYTLYKFTKSSSKCSQLVLCDSNINKGDPVFLDICGKEPLSLFGGYTYVAAISSEVEVNFFQ